MSPYPRAALNVVAFIHSTGKTGSTYKGLEEIMGLSPSGVRAAVRTAKRVGLCHVTPFHGSHGYSVVELTAKARALMARYSSGPAANENRPAVPKHSA